MFQSRAAAPAAAMLAALLAAAGPSPAQTWNEITPAAGPSPTPRGLASGVHDTLRHRLVVFGGQVGAGVYSNEIWAFDLAGHTWTDLTPVAGPMPSARRTPQSAYDPTGDRMITWSGQRSGGNVNDSWVFDFGTGLWTQLLPPNPIPNIRYGVASVWDPLAGEVVSFAGFTAAGRFQDTWRLDAAGPSWTDVTPVSPNPIARCLHSASYDAAGHRMIMYGGASTGGPRDDIWAFDLSTDTWTDLTPAVRPSGRLHATNAYDATNHRVSIFGGDRPTGGGKTNEVQIFDLGTNEWHLLPVSGTPPTERHGAAGMWVPGEDRLVIFGGHDGSWSDEVWALESLSESVGVTPDPPAAARLRAVPNPFRTETTIQVGTTGPGTLSIHDATGRLVQKLRWAAGSQVTWNGRDALGRSVPGGVYFLRLSGGEPAATARVIRLR